MAIKRTATILCILLLACTGASAQKKAETKLYNKTLAKPTLAAFDKFLSKYPESVYAPEILGKKDTLLNVSPYTMQDAAEIAAPFIGAGAEYKAWGKRSEAIDRIGVLAINADSLTTGYLRMMTLVQENGSWNLENSYDLPAFEDEEMSSIAFVDDCNMLRILKKDCLRFNCLLSNDGASRQNYVAAIWNTTDEQLYKVTFSGKNILTGNADPYKIQGRSDIKMQSATNRPEMQLLANDIDKNPQLAAVSDADYLTDEAMQFWLKNNPDALTTARKVVAATLPEESSLVQAYLSAKGKQNSAKYRAAMFDFRGYTVIVAYQKDSNDYILAWVEPECKDHYRDRLLNSISFTNASNLELFYYHGKRTYKYHLNLASKALSHS